jgi:benzoyl-CoA reductase/2-hydroxyglutaryl-CoA dehydratase subunit BcrC/BadD/HgdB
MAQLKSQIALKGLLKDYFTGMKAPIAWCTSAGPAEILRALGFEVYFPENHGALLGASRTAEKYIPRAHQEGYDGEICSYLTADIGAWLMKETPLTKIYGLESIPTPDLIVFNTNQCREVAEWFNFFGREYNCPVVGIFPPRYLENITQAEIDNVVSQFKELIKVGEKIIGKPLDPEKLSETVRLSFEGSQLWKEVLETASHSPSPLTFFDGCILMAPIVILRGTQRCVDFYKDALAELKELVAQDEGAIPNEKVRIYWEGMPVWGRLRSLSEFFAENQTSVVASTYCNSWVFDHFDPDNPMESMAYAYTQIFINRGENTKLEMMKDIMENFEVDGVVFHDSKTCFNNANSRFGLPKRVEESTGIDTISFDGDLVDLRFFSEGQTRTKLETFIEQLKYNK